MKLQIRKIMTNHNGSYNKHDKDKTTIYDGFIDSIQEEIRKENYKKLWDKYGKLISIVTSVVLLSSAGYSFWKKRDLAEKEAVSAQFTIAQNELNAGSADNALIHFREIGKNGKKNYATLAKLEYAAILAEKHDKKAIEQYKSVWDNNETPQIFRDLAYIYYVNTSLDLLENAELNKQLPGFINKLSEEFVGKKWKFLSLEILGYCYIKQQDYKKAKQTFSELARSEKIPDGMLERAREIIQYIDQVSEIKK